MFLVTHAILQIKKLQLWKTLILKICCANEVFLSFHARNHILRLNFNFSITCWECINHTWFNIRNSYFFTLININLSSYQNFLSYIKVNNIILKRWHVCLSVLKILSIGCSIYNIYISAIKKRVRMRIYFSFLHISPGILKQGLKIIFF